MSNSVMTCGEFEILLSDYLDGTLSAAEASGVEAHLESCASCSELASDARAAIAFMERVADVETPPRLAAQILEETASGRHGRLGSPRGIRGWLGRLFGPVLQPRPVMGMLMTILSFSMMARCAHIPVRQLQPSDMDPRQIWSALDDRADRVWVRSVKFYENLKVVYEIQSRLREWTEQQEEEERNQAASRPVEERRVGVASQESK